MRYLIATLSTKNCDPLHIFGSTEKKDFAIEKAKKFAKKYGITIGVFQYTKNKFCCKPSYIFN